MSFFDRFKGTGNGHDRLDPQRDISEMFDEIRCIAERLSDGHRATCDLIAPDGLDIEFEYGEVPVALSVRAAWVPTRDAYEVTLRSGRGFELKFPEVRMEQTAVVLDAVTVIAEMEWHDAGESSKGEYRW